MKKGMVATHSEQQDSLESDGKGPDKDLPVSDERRKLRRYFSV